MHPEGEVIHTSPHKLIPQPFIETLALIQFFLVLWITPNSYPTASHFWHCFQQDQKIILLKITFHDYMVCLHLMSELGVLRHYCILQSKFKQLEMGSSSEHWKYPIFLSNRGYLSSPKSQRRQKADFQDAQKTSSKHLLFWGDSLRINNCKVRCYPDCT